VVVSAREENCRVTLALWRRSRVDPASESYPLDAAGSSVMWMISASVIWSISAVACCYEHPRTLQPVERLDLGTFMGKTTVEAPAPFQTISFSRKVGDQIPLSNGVLLSCSWLPWPHLSLGQYRRACAAGNYVVIAPTRTVG
jgi:hypothetical protein